MLGEALSLRACVRGGGDGSRGSGSNSMSSKLASASSGGNGSTGSSAGSNRVRFFLTEIVGERTDGCKAFLDLAPTPFFAERIVKTKDGLFVRNSFALGPSCNVPHEPWHSG
jgi:hypothetical protein